MGGTIIHLGYNIICTGIIIERVQQDLQSRTQNTAVRGERERRGREGGKEGEGKGKGKGGREREGGREGERERQTDRQTDRQREKDEKTECNHNGTAFTLTP